METPITRKHMGLVRDLYLFCCFTGLAFIDLYNLKEENIKTFFDDGEWIVIHRQKTGTEADNGEISWIVQGWQSLSCTTL